MEYWTGANDLQVEGEWVWLSTGEPVTMDFWAAGEPNGVSNENCMEIVSGQYNDDRCDKPQRYICEISV